MSQMESTILLYLEKIFLNTPNPIFTRLNGLRTRYFNPNENCRPMDACDYIKLPENDMQ